LLIAAEPLALVAQLASLSFDGDTALAVLGSNFGRLLGLRLGAAVLAWTVLATGRTWPVLVIGAADAFVDGASAHAIAGLPGAGPKRSRSRFPSSCSWRRLRCPSSG